MIKELINRIDAKLREERLYADVYQYPGLPVVMIEIHWGDWKHEHLRCDYLIDNYFPELGAMGTEVTEEDGSDCYSGIHKYFVKYSVAKEEL